MSSLPPQQGGFDPKNIPFPYGKRRPKISFQAAGSMYISPPAHLAGLRGSAYRYGQTQVGGTTNMVSNGQALYPLLRDVNVGATTVKMILGGGTFFDAVADALYGTVVDTLPAAPGFSGGRDLFFDGEYVGGITAGLNFDYSNIAREGFAPAGTVNQVTNGSQTITFAGSNLTTVTLPGYAYTPGMNGIRIGDLLDVTITGTHFYYRVVQVVSATQLTVWPPWQQASAGPGAGYAYNVWRTGYGSRSRIVSIPNIPGSGVFNYYAGNLRQKGNTNAGGTSFFAGTVECSNANTNHFMAPLNTGATQVNASDIALYRSFLLYGYGTAIGWSIAGFPSSFTTGFGTNDFPGGNIAVIEPDDEFVSFEFLGDQLVAIFENAMWYVRPTGSVPEFDFQKLPEVNGPHAYSTSDVTANGQLLGGTSSSKFTRPTTTGRSSVYLYNAQGLCQFQGGLATTISQPVDAFNWASFQNGATETYNVSYEETTDSVLFYDPAANAAASKGVCLAYGIARQEWSLLDVASGSNCISAIPKDLLDTYRRPWTVFYYQKGTNQVHQMSQTIDADESTFTTPGGRVWTWASLIAPVSEIYGDYSAEYFSIRARAATSATPPTNLQVTIYGGQSPYNMKVRKTFTIVAYDTGTPDARHSIGGKVDDPFMAVVLTGSKWIELAGVDMFDSSWAGSR